MDRILNITAILFLCLTAAQAQLLFEVQVPVKFAITDKMQQVYIVTPEDVLIKYDQRGKEMGRYTNNYLGELEVVDPTNPINVVLYYPNLQTLVTLDVTMNEISRTNLVSYGFFNIDALCSTNDGNIWLMDGMEFRLKKINRNGKILYTSENLMILMGQPFRPVKLLERNNKVFALDPEKGIYVFDNMGNFDKRYDLSGVTYFQMLGTQIFYLYNGTPHVLDTQLFMHNRLTLPGDLTEDLLYFNVQVDRCFMFTKDGFQVWEL